MNVMVAAGTKLCQGSVCYTILWFREGYIRSLLGQLRTSCKTIFLVPHAHIIMHSAVWFELTNQRVIPPHFKGKLLRTPDPHMQEVLGMRYFMHVQSWVCTRILFGRGGWGWGYVGCCVAAKFLHSPDGTVHVSPEQYCPLSCLCYPTKLVASHRWPHVTLLSKFKQTFLLGYNCSYNINVNWSEVWFQVLSVPDNDMWPSYR